MQRLHLATCTLFALPVAALLHVGTCQGGQLQGLEQSSVEGSGSVSVEAAQTDSLMLVNRTDTAFVYLAFHPRTARPQPAEVEVDLDDPRPEYVAAGDTTALWSCDSLDTYENYTLHLYRIPARAEGVVHAPLARSVRLTAERLNAARRRNCRLEIGGL